MAKVNKLKLENEHIAEEMVEHLILEKIGALPNHGHAEKIRLTKRVKKSDKSQKSSSWIFFVIAFSIIGYELWYLGSYILTKYPKLEASLLNIWINLFY